MTYEVLFYTPGVRAEPLAFKVDDYRLDSFLAGAALCGMRNYVLLRKRKFTPT